MSPLFTYCISFLVLFAIRKLGIRGEESKEEAWVCICDWLQEPRTSLQLHKTKIKTISSHGTRRIFILSPLYIMKTQEKTVLSTEQKMREVATETKEASSSLRQKIKNIVATIITAALLVWAKPAMPQTQKSTDQDSIKTVQPKKSDPTWAFFLDPAYSPTDKVTTVRLSGGGSVHGVKVGGFLDLTSTPDDVINGSSAFGKLTVSQPLDKVIKGTSLAVEYTFNSATQDKLRWWFTYVRLMKKDGSLVIKFYPVSEKWFEPFVLVGADKKMGKFKVSAFCGSDIKSKSFYGEADASYQLTKHIAPFVQGRFGWSYTGKVHPDAYVGLRVKL